jgi:hypothetical protein
MKIYAPVKDANGIYASVRFVNGVGETNNPALIEWFRKHGYRVEKCEETPIVNVEKREDHPVTTEPNLDDMTSDEIRAWAKANGFGGVIKNTRDKEKLLKLIRG